MHRQSLDCYLTRCETCTVLMDNYAELLMIASNIIVTQSRNDVINPGMFC